MLFKWLRRRVRTSTHVWYMTVLFVTRIVQLAWATGLWWTLRLQGALEGDEVEKKIFVFFSFFFFSFFSQVLLWTLGQVGDFWLRLLFQIGATIVALDAPMISTRKPARTALTYMLLVGLVSMAFSVTIADLTWWLWGAMLLWTDVFLQSALTLSLIWIYRLDATRDPASGKPSKVSINIAFASLLFFKKKSLLQNQNAVTGFFRSRRWRL